MKKQTAILKLTKETWVSNTPYDGKCHLESSNPVLFNTAIMMEANPNDYGGTRIRFTAAMVDSMNVRETVEEIWEMINGQ